MFSKRKIFVNDKPYIVLDDVFTKTCQGPNYNYSFDKTNGFFARWGRRKSDNPSFSPIGPELADIELTTICEGVNGKLCDFCYKNNTIRGNWMPFKTFKRIFKNLPSSVTQIAYGVDSQCTGNPDCWEIFHYTRNHGVIPNVTVAQIDNETAGELAKVMGAVSVTVHDDRDICYSSVNYLAKHAIKTKVLKQINIHALVSLQTEKLVYETLYDSTKMRFVNSVVLLALKQKSRGISFDPLPQKNFEKLVKYAFKIGAKIGFDSCNCNRFLKAVRNHPQYESFKMVAEPCESGIFSGYISVNSEFFPCSFLENTSGWENGIDLKNVLDFQKDVWYNPRMVKFRRKLIRNKRNCPVYNI